MKNGKFFAITGLVNYLVVVFLNAFTDLGHKIIIQNTIFKVYDGSTQIVLTAIVNALILLPFILVFSPSGFLADRFAKNTIMKYSALFAVFITLAITFAYYNGMFIFAFAMTFLLALQSAIYAPAKYGYIKELVGDEFISSGNGAVQAVTTVAILGGILFYSALFELSLDEFKTKEDILYQIAPIGWLLVFGSVVEWYLASKLPNKVVIKSKKKFDLKKYLKGFYLIKNLKVVSRKKEILNAIFALSLFWAISQVVLAVFGEYAKTVLNVTNALVVQGVMALAGIGIVLGSIIAAKLSKYYINIGLSVIGSIAITIVVFLIPFIKSMSVMAFMFLIFGIFSGFLLVALNAKIQYLAPKIHLGTILAGNNFIQNIFMFLFLVVTAIFSYYGMNSTILIYLMVLVGTILSALLIKNYKIDAFWSFLYMLFSLRYKFNYFGLEYLENKESVLLLGNHVSWIDWLILQIPLKQKINYLMDKDIYNNRWFNSFVKAGEAIPLSAKSSKGALKEASNRLKNGKIVAIFPEGQIATSKKLNSFHRGYELIENKKHIVAFYISGMFGSIFAKYKAKGSVPFFKRRVVNVYFKEVDIDISANELQKVIESMGKINEVK